MLRLLIALMLLPLNLAAQSLDQRLAALKPGQWLSYEVPLQEGVRAGCCLTWDRSKVRDAVCRLDDENWSFGHRDSDPMPLPGAGLRILLRRDAKGFDQARMIGPHCRIEAGTAELAEAGKFAAEASVALLGRQLDSDSDELRSQRVAAIAYHAGADADAALIAASAPGQREELRRDAVFWLTQTRGETGFRTVRDLLQREADEDLRRHEVFALSQSPIAAAKVELRRMARAHDEPEVRGEALFWLSQAKDPETEALVREILASADSDELREKAIFALSQLPPKRAIPALRTLVEQQGASREVRKQALFWLAQVDDDSVLTVFDELLGD